MDIQRTITIVLPADDDLRATVAAFQSVQQHLTTPCYHDGAPLGALALHRACYRDVVGTLNSQMTCSAIRLTAGTYASAKSNGHPAQHPFRFQRPRALFEALTVPQPEKGKVRGKATRRRLAVWQRALIRQAATNQAQTLGMVVAEVNPAYTSQNCSRCGLRGVRKRHRFTCPSCGHEAHADVNAAVNIRNRYTAFRGSGLPVS